MLPKAPTNGQATATFLLTYVMQIALHMHYICRRRNHLTVSTDYLIRRNRRLARRRWPAINIDLLETLKSLSKEFCFSISSGDLLLLDKGWYVTHVGLIRLARRNRCHGVLAEPAQEFCDPKEGRWVFRATVYKSRTCGGFVGYGDADPSNVSSLVRGAEMRIAETRAVNRALRKAYGIGLCSVEEIGTISNPTEKFPPKTRMEAAMALALKFAIVCAKSFASTSSTPNWSRPTPSTSAARRRSERRAGNKSRTSFCY